MRAYDEFLRSKLRRAEPCGFDPTDVGTFLYDWQRDIVRWAIRRGRASIFADCGLGKTPMQLEWARNISAHSGKPVLILAPLAVASQTRREGEKFGIHVTVCRTASDVAEGVNVTNYEMLHHFTPNVFGGVVLDESSILKSFTGKTRTQIINAFAETPYRLACTATPSPNDYMELGNHAEFVGVMTRPEMLSMFFTHDGGDTSKWRLKGHAENPFWKWLCSWAVMVRKPSDLGYDDDGFTLPPMRVHDVTVDSEEPTPGALFALEASGLMERRRARRASLLPRVDAAAKLANGSDDAWLVWCDLNDESAALSERIRGAVEVVGAHSLEYKERALLDFAEGRSRVLVTKPSIAGFGLNLQRCHNIIFVGLSDSFEAYYQATRRCWRFGQESPVDVYVVTADTEGAVVRNIRRKEGEALRMAENMVANMQELNRADVRGSARESSPDARDVSVGNSWTMHLGDCVDVCREIGTESVGYSLFSPPFASLYTYSNSERDMGNCGDWEDFMAHFSYLIPELLRVTMPGRNLSFHCMQLPISKEREGYIGLRDFRGILIRAFEAAGWIYHSEVCIWKDPVTAMQRTKALGLLWKQIKKDSTMSRQGIADYVVTMRKPGANPRPVGHKPEDFPVDLWQKWASPVWMDINPSRTLNRDGAKEENDERHICPLQLDVIERCLALWSAPGDTVLSPFAGIGSEGYMAVKTGRKFIGAELKPSYYKLACKNLSQAESELASSTLFGALA